MVLLEILNISKQSKIVKLSLSSGCTMADCTVKVCRICISMDCQLHHLHEDMKLYKAYEALTELALADEQGLPPYLCTDCADQLMNYVRFRKKSFQAHLTFLDIIKHHGHLSVESIQAAIKTPHSDSDNKHTEEEIEIKQEDIPEVPIATELSDEIKTEFIPGVGADDDLVGGEAIANPYVVEVNVIVKEEVIDEASVSDHVDDSILITDEEVSLDRRLPSEEGNKWNTVEGREGAEGMKYQMKVVQQQGAEVNEKLLQNVKLSSDQNDSETQFLNPLQALAKITLHYCYMCDYKTESKIQILGHMALHSGNKSESQCKKTYGSKEGLKRLVLTHTVSKEWSRDVSEKSFSNKGNLINNSQKHLGRKPFQCDICKKSFSRKFYLQTHMAIHTGEKSNICEVCGRRFTQKLNLQRHRLRHLDEKPFKCHLCDKSFTLKCTLKKHVLTHSDVRPYTCDVCKTSFHAKGSLRSHVLIHSDDKPHPCHLCEKSFRHMCTLRRHILVHTDVKPFSCELCERSFRERCRLKKHMLQHSR